MKVESSLSLLKTIVDYFYGIFIGNLMFLISNIPLLYMLFFVLPPRSVTPSTIEIFICILPIGPAFTALLYAMNKLVSDGDISTIRNYWKSYKTNFRYVIGIWSGICFFMVLLGNDILRSYSMFYYLQVIGFVILMFCSVYLLAILSRFETPGIKALVMAFYSIFSHLRETLLLLGMMIFTAIIIGIKPSVGILFAISTFAVLVMIVLKDYLKNLES